MARAKSRDASTPVENELGLMRSARKKVGPYASNETLRSHLRSARGKLHWAVNGYFRAAVLERLDAGAAAADFEPRGIVTTGAPDFASRAEGDEDDGDDEDDDDDASTSAPPLPPLVWETMLSRVPPSDVCAAAAASKTARDASRSALVWRRQYERRWGAHAAARVASRGVASRGVPARSGVVRRGGEGFDGAGPEPRDAEAAAAERGAATERAAFATVDWRAAYKRRHEQERDMTCPECLSCKVMPIVYGFPSPALVTALKRSEVLLGGDYLVEGDPSWACRLCQSRWRAWPFAWPDPGDVRAIKAGIVPHPGLSGESGGGRGRGADLDDVSPLPRWEETNRPPFLSPPAPEDDVSEP